MRPSDIRAEIAVVDGELARLTEYRAVLVRAEELASKGLTSTAKHRSVSPVDVSTTPGLAPYTKRAAARSNREHAGLKLLYEKDVTQASLARELGESRSRVASWFAVGDLNRPIPRSIAEKLRDKYGVPLGAWARIAG